MLERFKAAHQVAVKLEDKSFRFEENDFDVGYAGYLIQYLETKLPQDYSGN